MLRNILNIITVFTFILTFIVLLITAFWLIYPYKPLIFNTAKFKVTTKVVKQGGTLIYISDYCKYVDEEATVSRAFMNDLIFAVPEMTTNREKGCHVITVAIPVPRELPVGTYFLRNTYKYRINPIREIILTEDTEKFSVIN